MAESLIHMEGPKKHEDFRKKWVYLDAGEVNPLLEVPTTLAGKVAEDWAHLKGIARDLRPLKRAMMHLRKAGLTGQLVVKEFLERRIAPLQDHSKRMWEYNRVSNAMHLSPQDLKAAELGNLMRLLYTTEKPGGISDQALPL